MKQLLTKRKYHVDGTWFAPVKFLEGFKSVIRAEHINQVSSAGDWTGYILQKILGRYYLILFWQENSYPNSGFDIVTNSDYMIKMESEPTKAECDEICWSIANL